MQSNRVHVYYKGSCLSHNAGRHLRQHGVASLQANLPMGFIVKSTVPCVVSVEEISPVWILTVIKRQVLGYFGAPFEKFLVGEDHKRRVVGVFFWHNCASPQEK